MGIDVETWRARIGLYHAGSVGRYLKRQHKAASAGRVKSRSGGGVSGEMLNCLFHFVVTCLIALMYTDLHFVSPYLSSCMKFNGFDQKVLHFVSSGLIACRGVVSRALAIAKSTVVDLSLLLIISGDVELNPGPVEELNLKNLMNALSKVESKWFTIGIQLNIDHGRLESFENNSRGYCGKSLAKVLNYWLKENTDVAVTWQSIVDVLESDSVCEMSLASEIKTRNCQSTDDGNVKERLQTANGISDKTSRDNDSSDADSLTTEQDLYSQGEFSEDYTNASDPKRPKLCSSGGADQNTRSMSTNCYTHQDFNVAGHGGLLESVNYMVTIQKADDTSLIDKNVGLLHLACEDGSLKVVQSLANEMRKNGTLQSALTMYTDDGRTPLHLASYFGHFDIVKYFICELKCNPNIPSREKCVTPLNFAARGGHLDIVKYLIEEQKRDPNVKTKSNNTPLHHAAQFGKLEVVKYLIETHNCNPIEIGQNNCLPIHLACESGHLEVVKYLLNEDMLKKNGVNMSVSEILESRIEDGRTPLHLASYHGHLDVVKFLISDMKCDPNIETPKYGMTPLHFSARRGCLPIAKFLVEQGCDPMAKNKIHGNNALHFAAREGELEVVKFFIEECDCSPHVKGYLDRTPLQWAGVQNHLEVVEYLQSLLN